MALFKVSKGNSTNLPTTKTDGFCWFTYDDGKFYIDYTEPGNSTVKRKALNAELADKDKLGNIINNTYAANLNLSNHTLQLMAQDGTSVLATVTLPDEKVAQNNTTTNKNYRILLSYDSNNTNETNTVNKSGNLIYNPSTNTLATGNMNLTGALDVIGNVDLHNQTSIDNLTAGTVLVTGSTNFSQIPTAPTAAAGDNSTKLATTEFVTNSVAGLSGAMHFKGTTTTAIADGSTTNPISIGGSNYTATAGDVVLREISTGNVFEYVWTGSAWEMLGRDTSFKVTQTAVSSPAASGNTTAFIDTISQDTNGNITVTKKNLDTSGTWNGNAVTATTASKLNNTSKIGDTNKPVYFTANGVPAAINYTIDKSVPSTAVFTDRYVNSATFTDDTTNTSAFPVKMTLTRAGSDTATVTANIPKVSSSSAGVAPKGTAVSTQSQTTKFLREDGTWAAPSYTAIAEDEIYPVNVTLTSLTQGTSNKTHTEILTAVNAGKLPIVNTAYGTTKMVASLTFVNSDKAVFTYENQMDNEMTYAAMEIINNTVTLSWKNQYIVAADLGDAAFDDIVPIEHGGTGNSDGYIRTGAKPALPTGTYATAEGRMNLSQGEASHAEGEQNWAQGYYSHVEGYKNIIHGRSGHVFGEYNIADSEPREPDLRSDYIEIVGNGTADDTRSNARTLDWDGNEWLAGNLTATELKGYVTVGQLNGSTLGQKATAEGYNTTASGNYSHAEGWGTTASGINSHAEGETTIASGNMSHAEGEYTTASNWFSHAEGDYTTASGGSSHAEGENTTASGDCSHSEGDQTTAFGLASHAEGGCTEGWDEGTAYPIYLTGNGTTYTYNTEYESMTIYNQIYCENTNKGTVITNISGNTITVASTLGELNNTCCAIINQKVEAVTILGPMALGDYSHAEGNGTVSLNVNSHAEGFGTIASGYQSHAEGEFTTASGNYGAHAEGAGTTASGDCSHSENYNTTASGSYSHAEGYYTTAQRRSQHTFGEYNILDTTGNGISVKGQYIEIVGNGTSSQRHNARTLDWDGNEVLAGKLTIGTSPTENMDVTTKQYVDNLVSTTIPSGSLLTDENVKQNAAITTNSNYPLLLGYSDTTNEVINSVNKTDALRYNPSTQLLTAPKISGNIQPGSSIGGVYYKYDSFSNWGASGGKTGWVKLYSVPLDNSNRLFNRIVDFVIWRSYNSPAPEIYYIRAVSQYQNIQLMQIGGKYRSTDEQLITKFRVIADTTNHVLYFEIYIENKGSSNTGYVRTIFYGENSTFTKLNEVQTEADSAFSIRATLENLGKTAFIGDLTGNVTGTADKATAANLTTTENAIAKYSNTTGSFANSGVTIDSNNNIATSGNITTKGTYIFGTNTSDKTNRYISSDATNNIFAKINSTYALVITDAEVRRGASASTMNLGNSSYPWNNIYGTNIHGNGSNLTSLNATNLSSGTVAFARLPSMYWANTAIASAASYNTAPEVASVKIGNGTASAAGAKSVTLQYDATLETLNFVFA